MYWVSDGYNLIENSPRSITEYGFDEHVKKVDTAMVWSKNGRTYLFSETSFIRYDEDQNRVDDGYPKNISEKWNDIPNNLDAAVSLDNNKTYFFKGNLFWLYNNDLIRPEAGYPRRTSTYRLNCSN